MPVMGPCYTVETPSQIAARETYNANVQNEVQLRNLLAAAPSPLRDVIVAANLAACKAASTVVEIAPSTIQNAAGVIVNAHK